MNIVEIVASYKELIRLLECEKLEISRGLQGDCLKEYIQLIESEKHFIEKCLCQLTEN